MLLLSQQHFLQLSGHRIEDKQPFIPAGVKISPGKQTVDGMENEEMIILKQL